MLAFTHTNTGPDTQRTHTLVVWSVVALHALALVAWRQAPQATPLDSPQSVAMEMVLAPVSPTRAHMQASKPATTAATTVAKSFPTPAHAPPATSSIASSQTSPHTSPISPPTPNATSATHSAETSPASSNAANSRAAATNATAPAFSLPSSDAQGLNNPKPAYPRLSRRLNEQGQVVVRVFVAADGLPQQGEIKTSSGYDRLDQEALRTVLRWRFVPGQRLGTPEAMWFNVPVNFVLE